MRLSPRFQRGLRLMLERSFEPGTTTAEGGGGTGGGGADDRLAGMDTVHLSIPPRIPIPPLSHLALHPRHFTRRESDYKSSLTTKTFSSASVYTAPRACWGGAS